MDESGSELDLPGYRFHPTEEELLNFYLRRMVLGKKLNLDIIGTIHLYRFDPWELPELAKIGEREWYFFVVRDPRQSTRGRPSRTTKNGFWKATGKEQPIFNTTGPKHLIGHKKTLVFYMGRAPHGAKTDWVMNEYSLPETSSQNPLSTEGIVLCKIYRKATPMKVLEQRAAMANLDAFASTTTAGTVSPSELDRNSRANNLGRVHENELVAKKEEVKKGVEISPVPTPTARRANLPELEVSGHGLEWHDLVLSTLMSPWMGRWSPVENLFNV
ncbi:uncharacterized protein A4U43_C10F2280 [Asparagus officinalis]|uniref:NAC domain-containing protein n=1 Tax=Asparagus officinalis TaxID=4686 RepID=A0A5P1E332_ASPOF|nr:NAC domain-containing protein 35-like [Asparagus officinalis]ONK55917.1 uncharacterized protein A4U43_C10F2280 [Asparagus officinalis]